MSFAGFNSGKFVKGRLQAALYFMRKKNRARRSSEPTPPFEPQFEFIAGFLDLGGGSSITGFAPEFVGSASQNPENRCTLFTMQIIEGGPPQCGINFNKSEGATSAYLEYSINGGPPIHVDLIAEPDPWTQVDGTPAPALNDGDTISVYFSELLGGL